MSTTSTAWSDPIRPLSKDIRISRELPQYQQDRSVCFLQPLAVLMVELQGWRRSILFGRNKVSNVYRDSKERESQRSY